MRPTRESPNLIPDPERAPLIKKAFELYGSGTETRSAVLRQVSLLGLTTQTGKKLSAQSFENLLRNPIYAGWVVIPKWSLKERGSFEPLVTEELFDKVQDIIDGKRTAIVPHIKIMMTSRSDCSSGARIAANLLREAGLRAEMNDMPITVAEMVNAKR